MSEEPQGNAIAAAFPEPPSFWKHFTPENTALLEDLRQETEKESGHEQATLGENEVDRLLRLRLQELPPELRYLVPPEAPTTGQYNSFGELQDLHASAPTLTSLGFEQLYPKNNALDRTDELIKLARSTLMSFLSLTDILAKNPSLYAQKIEDMRQLFANLHQLVNEYRPHQARESLIRMMEERVDSRKAEVEKIKSLERRVDEMLGGLGKVDEDGRPSQEAQDKINGSESKTETDATRKIWSAMDAVEL